MSGTGITFTGCIGVGSIPAPTTVLHRSSWLAAGETASFSLQAPAGIQVGDTMVACVEAGGYAGSGGTYTLTPASGWTPLYVMPTGFEIMLNLYSKVADQADEDQTSSYTWSFSTTGGLAGLTVVHLGWRPRYGRTVSNASAVRVIGNSPVSLPSPGGDWQLAYVAQRTASAFAEPYPIPVITSTPANLLIGPVGDYRPGVLRVYASLGADPIDGEFLEPMDLPVNGLVVAAVSA